VTFALQEVHRGMVSNNPPTFHKLRMLGVQLI